MTSSRRLESWIVGVATLLLGFNLAYKLVNLASFYTRPRLDVVNAGEWEIERKPVTFTFDSGLRYDLNASQAWAALVPGDGIVHLGPHHEPFMVSMLHQLRCLDIMRDQLTKTRSQRDEQPVRHCMNYIRQMILCRGDTFLDPYRYPSNIHPVDPHPSRRCLDWRAVYEAVEKNQKEYAGLALDGTASDV